MCEITPTLEPFLLTLLRNHPAGLSEYDCLTEIWQSGQADFPKVEDHDTLQLFQAHFLLFHALYQLRDKLWTERMGHLEISPLQIVLHPYREGIHSIAPADPLREYYLDLENMRQSGPEEVDDMLVRFWTRYAANDELHEALAVLGLKAPVDYPLIKRRYRVLSMQYHPDRGGSKEKLQEINAAMALLRKLYTST